VRFRLQQKTLLTKVTNRLTRNQRSFFAEVIGTFIVVVLATGSVVIDARLNGKLGISFIAFAPFIGVAVGVYLFGKISMAHFNPAVTVGFLITRHITKVQSCYTRCITRKSFCKISNRKSSELGSKCSKLCLSNPNNN
jgi:hypothetical protein